MRSGDPGIIFLIIVVIGIAAGIIFDRVAGPSWLTRQFAGSTRGMVTSALVGNAGAFAGYHLTILLGIGRGLVGAILAAAVGAVIVLAGWRMVR